MGNWAYMILTLEGQNDRHKAEDQNGEKNIGWGGELPLSCDSSDLTALHVCQK